MLGAPTSGEFCASRGSVCEPSWRFSEIPLMAGRGYSARVGRKPRDGPGYTLGSESSFGELHRLRMEVWACIAATALGEYYGLRYKVHWCG